MNIEIYLKPPPRKKKKNPTPENPKNFSQFRLDTRLNVCLTFEKAFFYVNDESKLR